MPRQYTNHDYLCCCCIPIKCGMKALGVLCMIGTVFAILFSFDLVLNSRTSDANLNIVLKVYAIQVVPLVVAACYFWSWVRKDNDQTRTHLCTAFYYLAFTAVVRCFISVVLSRIMLRDSLWAYLYVFRKHHNNKDTPVWVIRSFHLNSED